jgi:hypothetical protein
MKRIVSYLFDEETLPPTPIVLATEPTWTDCPAFWAMDQPPAPMPAISKVEN